MSTGIKIIHTSDPIKPKNGSIIEWHSSLKGIKIIIRIHQLTK